MDNLNKLIELVKLADKVIELVDVPVPASEEAKHKQWLESGLAISAYREARAKIQVGKSDDFWEKLQEASESMQHILR